MDLVPDVVRYSRFSTGFGTRSGVNIRPISVPLSVPVYNHKSNKRFKSIIQFPLSPLPLPPSHAPHVIHSPLISISSRLFTSHFSSFMVPKRIVISEPFCEQLDSIEKALIEVQNHPSSYTNPKRNFRSNDRVKHQQYPVIFGEKWELPNIWDVGSVWG